MNVALSELGSWLTTAFFEKGAFMTHARSQEIILAQGGEIQRVQQFKSAPAFYLKDFFDDQYLMYRPERWLRTSKESLIKVLKELNHDITVTESFTEDDLYEKDFELLKKSFSEELRKVVLISREEFKVNDPQAARQRFMLKALEFGTGLPYGLFTPEYGVVGSTPEILYSINGLKLDTFALAGTAKLGEEERLLNSEKDRLEHDLVIKDIEEKLRPFSDEVSSLPTTTISFKEMIHLKTDIKARLHEETDLVKLTNDLSPTAALGGYPKEASLNFLKKTHYQARHPERYFGSSFGVIGQEIKQFLVSIRNIEWRGETFFIESGGGVLAASEISKEMAEIKLKRETIKRHYL